VEEEGGGKYFAIFEQSYFCETLSPSSPFLLYCHDFTNLIKFNSIGIFFLPRSFKADGIPVETKEAVKKTPGVAPTLKDMAWF
jgi:hypothetical protein